MTERPLISRLPPGLVTCAMLVACGGAGAERPHTATPAAASRCTFVRMELDERDAEEHSDSVSLMLVYTPPNASADAAPVSTRVRVQRNRVNDLQAQLQAHPGLVCDPEPGAPGGFRALVP